MYKALRDSIGLSEKLATLTDFQFRVWVMGLAKADSFGRIQAEPRLFRASAMPLIDAQDSAVEESLAALHAANLIHLYRDNGKFYAVYHDHIQAGMSNLKYRKSTLPAPPVNVCKCVEHEKCEKEATAVATAVSSAVPTADSLLFSSPSLSPSHEGGGGGEGEAPKVKPSKPVLTPQDEQLRQLFQLAKRQSIAAKDDTLRAYLIAWMRREGAGKLEERLMDPFVVGKTVIEIQEWMFPKFPQKKLAPAPKSFKCAVCNDSGKVVGGFLDGAPVMNDCSCRRRAARA